MKAGCFLPWWWHDRVLHEVDIMVIVVLRWRRAVFSVKGKPRKFSVISGWWIIESIEIIESINQKNSTFGSSPENFLPNIRPFAGKIVCGITSNEWRNRWVVVNLILYLKPLYCHNNFAALNIATWRPGGNRKPCSLKGWWDFGGVNF